MKVLGYSVGRFCKSAASAFLLLLSLSTYAAEMEHDDKPPVHPERSSLKEVTFTIDAEGGFAVKDAHGKPIGTACSTDPKASDVCPIFDPHHKVHVESVSNVSLIKYSGSPQCYLVIINGVAYVIPSAAYCQK